MEIAWGTKLQRNKDAEKSPDEKNPTGLSWYFEINYLMELKISLFTSTLYFARSSLIQSCSNEVW